MSKRCSAIDNNRRSSKRRKIEKNEEVNVAQPTSMLVEDPPVFDMATLPSEILGNLIFKYFDFKYWLRSLTLVNKQWHHAAIQSNVDKQLFVFGGQHYLHKYCIIAAKYKVTTIVLMIYQICVVRLVALLNSSPKLHTFVNPRTIVMDGNLKQPKLKFPFIKTVVLQSGLLKEFPNATRVQLVDEYSACGTFPNVEELAIQETEDVNALLKQYPSLKVLHVHSLKDSTLKLNPPNVEIRVTSTANDKNWRKHYSLHQTWDEAVFNLMETKETSNYETSLLDRREEYLFPAIVKNKSEMFFDCFLGTEYHDAADEHRRHVKLDCKLNRYLKYRQTEELINLLKKNSRALYKTMKPVQFMELQKLMTPTSLKKFFTKDQLADIMKLCDYNGSIAYHFIRSGYSLEDLEQAISDFGPLPYDWPNARGGALVDMAAKATRYDWIKYLIEHGAKVDISNFFNNFPYKDEWDIDDDDNDEIPIYDIAEIQSIIQLIHAKNAYKWSSDWIFDSDWISIPAEYQSQILDFIVKEFKINLKDVKRVDQKNNDDSNRGTSFINLMIKRMAKTKGSRDNIESLNMLGYAMEKRIDFDEIDGNNCTPLLTTITEGQPDLAIALLVLKGVSLELPKTNLPLCSAMVQRKEDYDIYRVIDALLAYGADINKFSVDEDNNPTVTALMLAAQEQPLDVVKYLVMRGAKADLENKDGRSALHMAIKAKNSEVVQFLAKYVDINKSNWYGLSPLHMAITPQQHPLVVKALLTNGADVNQVEPQTLKTPAMMACTETKDFLVLEELIQCKVDIKARDIDGHSLVYYFVKYFKADHNFSSKDAFLARVQHLMTGDNVAFIIDEANKVLELTKIDSSLLDNIFALCTSTQYFAEFLLDHVGFDINTQDGQGNVLLSYPMNEETFLYLMTKNPNVNIKNNEGKTPLKVLKERDDNKPSQKMLDALTERSKHTA